MTDDAPSGERNQLDQYARMQQGGLLRQYWAFLRHRKLWYMIPIVGVLVLLGALVFAGGTSIAPFLYTLF
ncbi:MAG TPA: DUF5989 family protein [Myxococcota bacterium]|nr:DUF5989 family protein [Myxococcota bacterium]